MSDGGLYTAMSGSVATSRQLDITSNNLANINTTGYKKNKTIFKDQLAEIEFDDINEAQAKDVGMPPRMLPVDKYNVLVDESFTEFTQGKLEKTDNKLDVAIHGNGFFKVQTPDGIRYTRDGSFIKSKEGLLVTSDGYPVLNDEGREIDLSEVQNLVINESGTLLNNNEEVTKFGIVTFENLERLEKIGKNLFEQRDNNQQEAEAEFTLHQGFLESSNVNPVEEMVSLISLHRQFELNGKAIESFSEIDKKSVGDLGRTS